MSLWTSLASLLLLLTSLLTSCTDTLPLTQITVVVRSDVANLDALEIQVDGMGKPQIAKANLTSKALPRTLAVVHQGGPLGPITITARGLEAGASVVERSAQLSFAKDQHVALVLQLSRACVAMTCTNAAETCIEGTCASRKVDVRKLPKWTVDLLAAEDAGPIEMDAAMSMPDAGMDAGMDAAISMPDADTDAAMDAQADTGPEPDAMPPGCPAEHEDCNDDGVCVPLTTLANCGGCGTKCELDVAVVDPQATLACSQMSCVAMCAAGYVDHDGVYENGCELPTFGVGPSQVDPLDDALVARITPALDVSCSQTLDFGSADLADEVTLCGQTLKPVLVTPTAGPELVVLAVRGLQVTAGVTLGFAGSRPVVLLVYGDANVAGRIDISANFATPGAGGNVACTSGTGTVGGSMGCGSGGCGSGGGGGGFGTPGGVGGNSQTGVMGGAAGLAEDPELASLRGGCAGGAGGNGSSSNPGGVAGSGGGALQISVSGTLSLAATAVLSAAGGGGRAPAMNGIRAGGGGGGSGGALRLEAGMLTTAAGAFITANGGSGGEGNSNSGSHTGASGANGAAASGVTAVGGGGGSSYGGDGGSGAASSVAAVKGGNGTKDCVGGVFCTDYYGGGGGGGGGVGRIVLQGAQACALDGSTSPPAAVTCPVL